MKKLMQVLIFSLLSTLVQGQTSNFVFFTEQGERFYLVLNGIQQNGTPETNVCITDLTATGFKVKVIFEDPKIPALDKTIMIEPGYEFTCNIKKNQKNEYVIRLLSKVPLEQAPPPPAAQKVIVYTTTPAATATTQTVTTGTTVTTTSAGGTITGGASVGVSTSTATVTTTSTTQTVTTGTAVPVAETQTLYVLPGYDGPHGCDWPMDPDDFEKAKASVSAQGFDDTRLKIAKQVAGSNCLLVSQVKELMTLFSFEDSRLEFAKFAYRHTLDTGNYFQLNDAFQFSSSVDELDEYLHTLNHHR